MFDRTHHAVQATLCLSLTVAFLVAFCICLVQAETAHAASEGLAERVQHRTVDNNGVNIHYVVLGEGPLVVLIHGFPGYWYSWSDLIEFLATDYTVAAMDTRGYNLSDQPAGVANYSLELLVSDVAAVIKAEGEESATVVGHDWGGGIAWSVAAMRPDLTERLIILNLPHPTALARELGTMGQQHINSTYARNFQHPESHKLVTAEGLASALARGDKALYAQHLEVFQRSSTDAMMNYYRANFPREPYDSGVFLELPPIKAPVLQFHGLADTALLPEGLNNTWDHLESDWTLVTLPGVGHWPHHDKPETVNAMIKAWLALH